MPRDVTGTYYLPAGNPVVADTLIEAPWANATLDDIAEALTFSLPRNGSAPMLGQLTLAGDAVANLEAVTLQQLNAAVASPNNWLGAGAIQWFAMQFPPAGWLECNGAEVSRTTYSNLFTVIGTTYGVGNGTTTFNLPDLRGQFLRGYDNGRGVDPGRVFGSTQAFSNQSHRHSITDPGHTHVADNHTHGITDPGHIHLGVPTFGSAVAPVASYQIGATPISNLSNTVAAATGLSLNFAGVTINGAYTGLANTNYQGSTEARPTNVAMIACIKAFGAFQVGGLGSMAFQNSDAVSITGGTAALASAQVAAAPTNPTDVVRLQDLVAGSGVNSVTSSSPATVDVDNSDPANPIISPQIEVASGLMQLNANGDVQRQQIIIGDEPDMNDNFVLEYLGAPFNFVSLRRIGSSEPAGWTVDAFNNLVCDNIFAMPYDVTVGRNFNIKVVGDDLQVQNYLNDGFTVNGDTGVTTFDVSITLPQNMTFGTSGTDGDLVAGFDTGGWYLKRPISGDVAMKVDSANKVTFPNSAAAIYDETTNRTLGSTYFNTSDVTMTVMVTLEGNGQSSVTIDGYTVFLVDTVSSVNTPVTFAVPAGLDYAVNDDSGTPTIVSWFEVY